jgi:glycosyltransferase involved in cell wall biosynthesis
MVIVQLTTDNRQDKREFHKDAPWFGTAPEALLQGLARLPEVQVHVVSCIQQPVSSPAKLADNIWFHSLVVPKGGWLRTGYQGCIRAVRQKVRELRPDLVHAHGTERDCALSAVFSGCPNVLTIHGNMRLIAAVNRARPFSYQWLAARLERLTIPRTDGVVCITSYTQAAVRPLARRTWVVNNAVDARFFEVNHQPVAPKLVVCVGNISVRKNQNQFIEALDPLAADGSFQMLFLGGASGNDPYARRFFELVRARPWCRYGGMVDRDGLKRVLGEASALALPSLEDNCPMVVLEAMAAGVPVAAARVGGVPELIVEGRTGLMFDPLHAGETCQALSRIIQDPAFADRLATEARQEARARFHPEQIAHQHLEIYREVIRSRS